MCVSKYLCCKSVLLRNWSNQKNYWIGNILFYNNVLECPPANFYIYMFLVSNVSLPDFSLFSHLKDARVIRQHWLVFSSDRVGRISMGSKQRQHAFTWEAKSCAEFQVAVSCRSFLMPILSSDRRVVPDSMRSGAPLGTKNAEARLPGPLYWTKSIF